MIWADIEYQVEEGFVQLIRASDLGRHPLRHRLKISRVASVPQVGRRSRTILNLSARPKRPRTRRTPAQEFPSVNESSVPCPHPAAMLRIASVLPDALALMFYADGADEVLWAKLDLADGFWRMVVASPHEWGFAFQLPPRPEDPEDDAYFVIPSALQMGWTNSPAFFCDATEATATLITRILALTARGGLSSPHALEHHCLPQPTPDPRPWATPSLVLIRVYVDDFILGLAGPPDRLSKTAECLWLGRAAMHGVHALFPPPQLLPRTTPASKDSISHKKLLRGDAMFHPEATILGVRMFGHPRSQRCVSLPRERVDKYLTDVTKVLSDSRVARSTLQKICGRCEFLRSVLPSLRGCLTGLYRALAATTHLSHVGIGRSSPLRATLLELQWLLTLHRDGPPVHITELVAPAKPHVYGSVDASGLGLGGVILPHTLFVRPSIWQLHFPADIRIAISDGQISMVDCEACALLFADILLDLILPCPAGVSAFWFSDNAPTVAASTRGSSRAASPVPNQVQRARAIRQGRTRRGPTHVEHTPGIDNTMADWLSRNFPPASDLLDSFFASVWAPPLSPPPRQLHSWQTVTPPPALASLIFGLLRRQVPALRAAPPGLGSDGSPLPETSGLTLGCETCSTPPAFWNESTCSWPLLHPSGSHGPQVETALANLFRARPSHSRFASARTSLSPEDWLTLERSLLPT